MQHDRVGVGISKFYSPFSGMTLNKSLNLFDLNFFTVIARTAITSLLIKLYNFIPQLGLKWI